MRTLATVALCLLVASIRPAEGQVFFAQDEALKIAFPGASKVAQRSFVLTDQQKREIEKRAQTSLGSSLFTFFIGTKDGSCSGYAVIDTVEVRSMPATVMTVIGCDRGVRKTLVLAFHEPPEYLPHGNWMKLFENKRLSDDLSRGHGLPTIAGSTLSADAISSSVRKSLAALEVLIKE